MIDKSHLIGTWTTSQSRLVIFPLLRIMPKSDPIHVGIAVVLNDHGLVLVGKRSGRQHLAGKLEFPGGKLEPGETSEACVVRECLEETGCDITVVGLLKTIEHDYGDRFIRLDFWHCEVRQEPPRSQNHSVEWLPVTQLSPADFPEANRAIIQLLKQRFLQ